MGSLLTILNSTIGKKVLMSLTGLFLCSFLLVHVSGNLQLFKNDYGLAFNEYSVFMTSFVPIKIISYLLYATILIHSINAVVLTVLNRKARKVSYKSRKDPNSSTWASKNMGILGTVLLIFIVTHMANFWYSYMYGDVPWVEYSVNISTGEVTDPPIVIDGADLEPHEYIVGNAESPEIKKVVIRDLYAVVSEAFKQPLLVVLYLLGLIALAYHMVHGFQSSFQTLGIRHHIYTPIIRSVGIWLFGIIIPLLFAAMPVYFFLEMYN
jgi:succinate dehydrogenase / fumarate reductase cytochrome b subunit